MVYLERKSLWAMQSWYSNVCVLLRRKKHKIKPPWEGGRPKTLASALIPRLKDKGYLTPASHGFSVNKVSGLT